MKITHYGHACVLVEIPGAEGSTRVLFDPGTYSQGFEELRDLDLIMITHSHPDHLDSDRLAALITANPQVQLVVGAGSLAALNNPQYPEPMREPQHVVVPGEKISLHGVEIVVTGGEHACIHSALPASENLGYLLDESVFHPGDSFDEVPGSVELLLLPIGGPWMKIGEGIDYLRAIAPKTVVPIHQAGLAAVHQNMHCQLLKNLAPENTTVLVLEHATTQHISH
ncbi:MBL fold metallo-hydrolase [Nocardia sp. NPDC006630]|uniref:MBL fold metallo-hydrolase n=1 Tax=Nocardia sp. NPDC006630 TaxID=3157181 RepID=UPI0033AA1611